MKTVMENCLKNRLNLSGTNKKEPEQKNRTKWKQGIGLPRNSPNLAVKITWKHSGEKETFTPQKSELAHFCLGDSDKHTGVSKVYLQDHLNEQGSYSSLEQKFKCAESTPCLSRIFYQIAVCQINTTELL